MIYNKENSVQIANIRPLACAYLFADSLGRINSNPLAMSVFDQFLVYEDSLRQKEMNMLVFIGKISFNENLR